MSLRVLLIPFKRLLRKRTGSKISQNIFRISQTIFRLKSQDPSRLRVFFGSRIVFFSYVEAVLDGSQPADNAIGRQLWDLVQSVPKVRGWIGVGLELDWSWIGVGLELDWSWIGVGLELDLSWIGVGLDWSWIGVGLELDWS